MQTNYELTRSDLGYLKDRVFDVLQRVNQRMEFPGSSREIQMMVDEVKMVSAFVVDQIREDVPFKEQIEAIMDAVEIRNRLQSVKTLAPLADELKALYHDLEIITGWYFDEVTVIKGIVDTIFAVEIKDQITDVQLGQLIDRDIIDVEHDLAASQVLTVHTRLTPDLFTQGKVELLLYVQNEKAK